MRKYSGGTFISSVTPVVHDGGESGQVDVKLGFHSKQFASLQSEKMTRTNHSDSLIPHHPVRRNRSMGP